MFGIFRTRGFTSSIFVMKVRNVNHSSMQLFLIVYIEPCLDAEWISDEIFASCGADGQIQVIKLGSPKPLKTLTCAAPLHILPVPLILLYVEAIRTKLIRSSAIVHLHCLLLVPTT